MSTERAKQTSRGAARTQATAGGSTSCSSMEELFVAVQRIPFMEWAMVFRKFVFKAQIMARMAHTRRGRDWREFE